MPLLGNRECSTFRNSAGVGFYFLLSCDAAAAEEPEITTVITDLNKRNKFSEGL